MTGSVKVIPGNRREAEKKEKGHEDAGAHDGDRLDAWWACSVAVAVVPPRVLDAV